MGDEKKNTENDPSFVIRERLYDVECTERQLREGLWTKKPATVRPDGCNVKDKPLSSFWQNKAKYENDVTISWRNDMMPCGDFVSDVISISCKF